MGLSPDAPVRWKGVFVSGNQGPLAQRSKMGVPIHLRAGMRLLPP